jgi:hypothetical protein
MQSYTKMFFLTLRLLMTTLKSQINHFSSENTRGKMAVALFLPNRHWITWLILRLCISIDLIGKVFMNYIMSLRLNLLDQRSSSFITSYDSTSVFCKWKLYKCHWRCSWCQQNVSFSQYPFSCKQHWSINIISYD